MKISDLKPNPKNPRKISEKKMGGLVASLAKYGDLSGFVTNRRSGNLISGHQKQKAFQGKNSKIVIEVKYDIPTVARTVAEGYVEIDGERFKYREVDADAKWEAEAMIAANKHSGEWDADLLKMLVVDVPTVDLSAAGFEAIELSNFGIEIPQVSVPEVRVDYDSQKVVEEVHQVEGNADKNQHEGFSEEADAEYVKNTPEVLEQIPTEAQKLNANPFEQIHENSEVKGRRIVIIIDCPTDEIKKDLRDKLRPIVEPTGAKFF